MAHDFELRRLTDKLKKLTEEQTRVNQQILNSRRNEQRELDQVRHKFNNLIHNLEEKQKHISKQTDSYERQLAKLEDKIKSESAQSDDSNNTYSNRHNHRIL